MSDTKTPIGNQTDTINRNSPFVQMSFDLAKQDLFATSFAVEFQHFKAMPSPIGQNDRGDYRRNDGVDTITSNGMLYNCAGKFSATMTDNSRDKGKTDGGQLDASQCRIVMPRYYNAADGTLDANNRIYLAPGDRVYVADPTTDVLVSNYHKMDYEAGIDNIPMFPIVKLDSSIVDSQGIEYICGVNFSITQAGNIRWIDGARNPGIDPDTGKGRIYSIRYLYRAYWYVQSLPKEVRITNVTTGNLRAPERMAMHAILVREYVYHNQNRGDQQNQNKPKVPSRADAPVQENINPDKFVIPVDMSTIADGEE
jgi:hypothetical protein